MGNGFTLNFLSVSLSCFRNQSPKDIGSFGISSDEIFERLYTSVVLGWYGIPIPKTSSFSNMVILSISYFNTSL